MRTLLLLLALLSSAALFAQTQSKSKPANGAVAEKFHRMTDQFMKESLALSPVNASQAGYHKHKDKSGKEIELDALLDDVSPAAVARQRKFYADWRGRFQKETPLAQLGLEDQADWRLLDDQIAFSLLEFDKIQSYKHNPTQYVELIGNALFLPLTQEYAPKNVRVGHVLARMEQIPRFVAQAKQDLVDSDPIFVKTAIEENEGNIDLIQNTVGPEVPHDTPLRKKYEDSSAAAIKALQDFSQWLENDLGKRPTKSTWRLGKELYDQKFKLVLETDATPEQVLADAQKDLASVRAEMLQIALPLHKQMYPDHSDHSDLAEHERQNTIISEVLKKISDDHCQRDQLIATVQGDLESIKQFIREKKIVSLGPRDNLKVIPTPPFERGIYSVAGFHSAPPLEPTAEAEYWVTPVDPKFTDAQADSKLREYNNWVLRWLTIHEALPGHYVQAEHANNVQPLTRRLLRNLYGNGAYVEGWAEYIAQIMMDKGFADNDPRFRLSMRKIRLRVISNAILDVKMQTMNMSDQDAMDLMTKEAFQTQAEADGKLRRAKLSSAQLPTYYVGIRDWFALREKYMQAKGSGFSDLEFHDRVLDEGALPIHMLATIVLPQEKAEK